MAGQPKKFKSVEQMQIAIDKYFESCFRPLTNKEGNIVYDKDNNVTMVQFKPFVICGIANALDISRQTLLNYTKDFEYFDTITRAKARCEQYAEERLFDKDGVNGAKFSLINNYCNWKDKQETVLTDQRKIEIIDDLPTSSIE